MSSFRFKSLREATNRQPVAVEQSSVKTSEFFGINVFDRYKMHQNLSKEAYNNVVEAIDKGTKIDRKIANQVATGMKAWAIDRGATHYTHWFQPLNGATAEKHDAFFELSDNGSVIENFNGDMLVQQEPDASSFPSGGIRNTFEARGYTAWDPSSPAFVIGKTLCIPTIFVSYTGEALDYKTPLLKSLNALDNAAVAVCKYFDKDVTKVIATLGWEQEYFLVDEALFFARPDLWITGRTLMGHSSAKDQQLEDHYFGSIPDRVLAFMREFEIEALKLGIPVKTRHNEVAPNQFECAPVFEEANLAVDHNQLLMDIMAKIAQNHKFRVLLHEKPYKSVNGSGKHNNWSLMTNEKKNLLSPGKNPKTNIQFLTFLINIVRAVYEYDDLLRAGIASHGNEHRLGANEAPPAIMSVFIGTQLTSLLNDLEKRVTGKKLSPDEKADIKLDIGKIPEILLDNTDRNRTSPFAFTGNRFEFRAVGSSANCASAMIVLNTAVASQLKEFKKDVDALIKKRVKKDEAILQVLRKYIVESKRIRFEGNGYCDEWINEALKRGLKNTIDTTEALKTFVTEKSLKLFTDLKVLSEREMYARYEITLESYKNNIQIESRVLGDLALNHIIPTAVKYQNILIENVKGLKDIFGEKEFKVIASTEIQAIQEISNNINAIKQLVIDMIEERKKANVITDIHLKAEKYTKNVKPFLENIRTHIDKLEMIVDDELWPLPKYRELLFIR
ncbi:MAG: glutamine synthetase [Bacteroidetes bacterium GWA2_30_7]|nr:MAG: glutamine synthetase [Bacteroidetes bacterium GWA2_30_7]